MQIVCGIAAVKGANCVWDCCCTVSKLGGEVLLFREQISCAFAALKVAKSMGVLLNREQIVCGLTAVKGANCVWV